MPRPRLSKFRIKSPKIRIRKRLKFGDRITLVGKIVSLEKSSKEKPDKVAHAVLPDSGEQWIKE